MVNQRPHIWLIGGTSDSAAIAHQLSEQALPYIVTVTTENARRLYPANAQVQVGQLNPKTIEHLIQQWQVECILDASHPFACRISQQAVGCSQQRDIAYLRYERDAVDAIESNVEPDNETKSDQAAQAHEKTNIVFVDSIEALVGANHLQHQRVLFCLGYRHLHKFEPCRQTSQLFARVLPSVEAISGAIAAGFSNSEMIAFRPPISAALEAALWQQWQITCVVAKASGAPGGEHTKRQIAQQLGIKLVLIQRPKMDYPNQTNRLSDVVSFGIKILCRT